MVNVARFGEADDRMNQEVGLCLAGRAEREFLVRAVKRISGLEGDNAPPAQFAEIRPQFVRRIATHFEVVVHRLLNASDWATQIDRPR